jgi:hypothetical protein
MSNALALAAVTAVLKNLLDNALIDRSVSAAVGGTITVSALPPDRIEVGDEEQPRLNLFLYQVTPNPALRNLDLPSRDIRGRRTSNPPLALDLYYLLTAYSALDFETEILLGYAMQMLHETPVLTREAIRRTLAPPSPVDGSGILPPAVGALAASDLADQVEMVKVSPYQMNTEEMSKLWTAFQARYRPSVAYVATVVLIESQLPTRATLPVLTRGEPDIATGKDRGVVVQASLLPPYPAIDAATPPDEQLAVRMGEVLTITGRMLEADSVMVRFTHLRSEGVIELEPEPGAAAGRLEVTIPPDPPLDPQPDPGSPLHPESWRAGLYAVAMVLRNPGDTDRVTNALPVVLAPRLTDIAAAPAADDAVTVTVEISPPVHIGQQVRLLAGTREVPAEPLGAVSSTLEFTSAQLTPGAQWIRLRVDEAESLLIDRTARPPAFDATQEVIIP